MIQPIGVCVLIMGLMAGAEVPAEAPGELSASELVAQTRAALEELTALEASALADLSAFEQSEADLRRAIADANNALPARPKPLTNVNNADPNYIIEQVRLVEAYAKAWDQRQGRHRAALETLASLDSLRENLQQTYGPLLDRIDVLRPLLIEAQRRLQRGDITIADLELKDEAPDVGDWIRRSAELASQREALLAKVKDMLTRQEEDRAAVAALPEEDPNEAKVVKEIQLALAILAEASAVAEDQRQTLSGMRSETLPTEVKRTVDDLKARQAALDLVDKKIVAHHDALLAVVAQREALKTPQREDIQLPPEDEEIREVRRDVELAKRMIAYYEQDMTLQTELQRIGEELLQHAGESASEHTEFTYQVGRVWATLEFALALKAQGKLTDWQAPTDLTLGSVWAVWRSAQMRAFRHMDWVEEARSLLRDEAAQMADQALLEKEKEGLRQAETRLQTEISYSEFITEMADLPAADLLAKLDTEGEITRDLADRRAQMAVFKSKITDVDRDCARMLQEINVIENPYSREALRGNTERFLQQKEILETMLEGELLPDIQEELLPVAPTDERSFPEKLYDATDKTALELAEEESDYLRREQQHAREFLKYFSDLKAQLASLDAIIKERQTLDQTYEEHLNEQIRLEKRRYAAARQLRRHLRSGQLSSAQEPNDLGHWLSRADLLAAEETLRQTRQANATFYKRANYEINRLNMLILAGTWMQVRGDACTQRVRLVGRPVSLLGSALTPLNNLSDVERQNLNYDAREQQTDEDRFAVGLLLPFSRAKDRERFETPLRTYYLELTNTHRVIEDLEEADEAYGLMSQASLQEKEDLQGVGAIFDKTLAQRELDYQMARYTVAVARHPGQKARIEDAFRKAYGRDLTYRLQFNKDSLDEALVLLFSAQARLIGEKRLVQGATRLLSKVGLDQEIGWYGTQRALISTILETQTSREDELRQRITALRTSYEHFLKVNALRGLGIALVIPIVTFVLVRVIRRMAWRLEKRFESFEGEDASDRRRRLQTVTKTVSAAVSVLIWILAVIYIFAQLGLDVTPLIASASVMGFALAFGAQALVKDFFYGFFILIENQFTIGDIVALGGVTGTVEHITLRITVLRDLKGVVHYIPNGSIGQVSNKTQGWSRVVTEISVPHQEDPDRATEVLNEVLLAMAKNGPCASDIIETPTVAGVENMTERSVDIRIMIKTRPGQQWAVAREARRCIKKRFDQLGIAIPFPHRVVHHVYEDKDDAAPTP